MTQKKSKPSAPPASSKPKAPPRLTDEEVTALARDLVKDRIFMSDQLRKHEQNLLSSIFMPLVFMKPKDVRKMVDGDLAVLYEYFKEAGPRSINGRPMFFSMRWLNQADYARVRAEEQRLRVAIGDVVPAAEATE
jgi:hypothetical protein